jgi:ABC-2 type transport system permease protein
MTTTTAPARESRARFLDLVAAEWIKLRSLRSTWIAYGSAAVAVIAFNVGTASDTVGHWTERNASDRADFVRDGIPLQEAFTANAALIMMIALGAIGAMMILGEYGTGAIRTTFAAVPARRSVMAAKAAVLAAVTTVFGAVVALVSFVLTQAILDTRDVGVSLSHPGALRVVLASALLAPVSALIGLAVGTVLRKTAATMIVTVLLLVMPPMVFSEDRYWSAIAAHAMPFKAWLRLVEADPAPTPHPWTTGGAWTVYAVWAAIAAALAITSVNRRDQ